MFIHSTNIEHPPFIYLYIPIAYTLFSASLCVTHGDGFKSDPDSVTAFKKFVVQEEREGKNMNNFNVRGKWYSPTLSYLQKKGRGFLAGAIREDFWK